MMNIKIDELSENVKVEIDTKTKTIKFGKIFEKRTKEDTLYRCGFGLVQYEGSYTEKEIADLKTLNKKGKAIIEGLLLDRKIKFELSYSLPTKVLK